VESVPPRAGLGGVSRLESDSPVQVVAPKGSFEAYITCVVVANDNPRAAGTAASTVYSTTVIMFPDETTESNRKSGRHLIISVFGLYQC